MRHLGSLEDRQLAYRFHDYMLVRGVVTKVDEEGAEWSLWVVDEDQVDTARRELEEFLRAPNDGKYVEAATAAQHVRKEEERRNREARRLQRNVGQQWHRGQNAYVTMAFMVLCVATTILATDFGNGVRKFSNRPEVVRKLTFEDLVLPKRVQRQLPNIRKGQIWRLITPILLHGGLLHLFFNVYMLKQLGTVIEIRKSPFLLLGLILFAGVGSNVVQFWIGGGANFYGFSGVNYALFGFIWMRGHFHPREGLGAPRTLVIVLMVWFVLCWMGVIKNVANEAHAGGLVLGGLLGALPLRRRR